MEALLFLKIFACLICKVVVPRSQKEMYWKCIRDICMWSGDRGVCVCVCVCARARALQNKATHAMMLLIQVILSLKLYTVALGKERGSSTLSLSSLSLSLSSSSSPSGREDPVSSLCSPGWHQTYGDPPASASRALALQTCATSPALPSNTSF